MKFGVVDGRVYWSGGSTFGKDPLVVYGYRSLIADAIVRVCISENATYDAWHNHIMPLNYRQSQAIEHEVRRLLNSPERIENR